MYPDNLTKPSFDYLQKVVGFLDEPICILGGWAVYLTVNEKYKQALGKGDYLGSKDVDLGFHIEETASNFKNTAFVKAIEKLESEGFKEKGGRLYKQLDFDTGKELTPQEAQSKPYSEINDIFVDLLTDCIPGQLPKETSMKILDESLLYYAFTNPVNRTELAQFGKKLWLPKPWLLLATKIKALPGRTKDHKRQKDIADIADEQLMGAVATTKKNINSRKQLEG